MVLLKVLQLSLFFFRVLSKQMYHSHHMCCDIMDVSLLLHALESEAAFGVPGQTLGDPDWRHADGTES